MSVIEMNLTLYTEDAEAAMNAWEKLGRLALGLAFEGIQVETSIDRHDTLDDDTELETADADADTDDEQ